MWIITVYCVFMGNLDGYDSAPMPYDQAVVTMFRLAVMGAYAKMRHV